MPRKLPKLAYVKYVKGGRYAFFNTGRKNANGKPEFIALPDPASATFHQVYGALKAKRMQIAATSYTVSHLADDYERSAAFADHALNTRRAYRSALKKVRQFWGHFDADQLEPGHVREVFEAMDWGSGAQSSVLVTLGALYAWGRDTTPAKTKCEPTKGIKRPKGGEHAPWPDDILEAGLAAEDPVIRLAVHLLYFTGLRIDDGLKLRWGQIKDGTISVVPQKTARRRGKTVFIPVAEELAAVLQQTPRVGLTILPPANSAGQPLTQTRLRRDLQKFTRALGVETVPHGLRKNAVNSLLLAHCSVAETAAITDQTYQMVEHYAAQINRRQMAGAAIVKLDTARRNRA